MPWVALVLARRVSVEHLSNLGVAAFFSSFGETLEVDAACLSGTDCVVVHAVVRLKRKRFVPNEVLLSRKPWDSRLISIRKIRVWRLQDYYDSDGEYVPFFRTPPLPLFHHRHGGLPLVPAQLPLLLMRTTSRVVSVVGAIVTMPLTAMLLSSPCWTAWPARQVAPCPRRPGPHPPRLP
jgi:hypothetical protein